MSGVARASAIVDGQIDEKLLRGGMHGGVFVCAPLQVLRMTSRIGLIV